MGEAEHAHAVAAPAQHVLRRLRLEPRDHAGDLAGADVEAGDYRCAARRHRFHLGREAEAQHGHASPPLPLAFLAFSAALSASSRAAAAASDCRTVTRSGKRRSKLDDVARQQFLVAVEIDQAGQRRAGIALRQEHFDTVAEMQVPAPLGDQHRSFDRLGDRRDSASSKARKSFAAMLGAIADHQRQRGKALRHVGFQHRAVGGDQRRRGPPSARARRPCAP